MKNNNSIISGYTLIEIMVWILIVTMVTISWLYGIQSIWIGKVKLSEKTLLEQQAFYFSERFFELVKGGWTIDYEEYFNRKNVWNVTYSSGHYDKITWFWNGTTSMVYCLSWIWTANKMWTNGCITSHNTKGSNMLWDKLLYGQYAQQFIDYNSDRDADAWDEDSNGNLVWDDDDKYLWEWPEVFTSAGRVSELYLVNNSEKKRTFFRWLVIEDPNKPTWATCDFTDASKPTWSGCLGTIQFLKLEWVDWGNDHILANFDATENDGIIDTWIYDRKTYGLSSPIVADMTVDDSENYWTNILADNVNVKSMDMYLFPNKDSNLAWADSSDSTFISPYIRISMTMIPSWKSRKRIKWKSPEIKINTTINLTTDHN